jgi:hypothetical protein
MQYTAELHIAMAKQLREKAKALIEPTRGHAIKQSNGFLACAVLAAKDRGGISTQKFDFNALTPDWTIIDSQIASLAPIPTQSETVGSSYSELETEEERHLQVRQLIKLAIDSPTPDDLAEYLDFSTKFRRLAVWNARMAHMQRPGARIVATEYEWQTVGRYVLPDAVPIMILWPFSPIRFVYEHEDTGPPIGRASIDDPFAVEGEFRPGMLSKLFSSLKKQKHYRVWLEFRRQGFNYAGSAAAQGVLPLTQTTEGLADGSLIGKFAGENAKTAVQPSKNGVPSYRVTINDRLEPGERLVTMAHELGHIFCGHLGECNSSGKDDESGWPDRRWVSKHEKEVEAEAVAYLVASRAGLVTGSAAYLSTHARRANIETIDVELIVRAAARIERLAKIRYGSMVFQPPHKSDEPP